ncbi:DNA polymerase III subunit epsilon [Aquibaculum arenosum]|uniref:DNA polymerase III subunit epsilon n=1 Tax=Aquibaculum arenosum TaxID=3032591 RepID=A0ABT5YKX0_9PROT|nr:DNA polymerase III subunit epsilon [Fodinicurvata sp. CAU 1616]MDF2095596.1 DNA polymerase III subunit epsilon [Fodinicurvata sp. CAU 1616]
MREIVLDTETTGLDPLSGDRVVEIGCVELLNHVPTGQMRQYYINPDRDMPEEAFKVHGLSSEFLAGQPRFADIVEDFLSFVREDRLVIHNAEFDVRFLNAELARLGHSPIPMSRAVDTVAMARRRFPGAQASLDALCRRFDIDLSARSLHGALLDCQLLAAVYLELRGGRQPGLTLDSQAAAGTSRVVGVTRRYREPRPHAPSEAETAAHERMLDSLKEPLWRQ